MSKDNPFKQYLQLEQPRLGTAVIACSDDFFGAVARLIQPGEPVFIDDKYDEHGKWMDGWESRRRRGPGHDWCILKLGIPGIIRGVNIDTRFFTGNFPPQASLQVCSCDSDTPDENTNWLTILDKTSLQGDQQHFLPVHDAAPATHVRFNIFPDGGVARLRLFGEIAPHGEVLEATGVIDVFAMQNGGRALCCSDEHYGNMHNLNLPGRGLNMGDGWETARRRGPGHDWVIVQLGRPALIEQLQIDTAYFKGNYPDRVSVEAIALKSAPDQASAWATLKQWQTLLPEAKLSADSVHSFDQLAAVGAVTHLRMSIFPDGGVSRLRVQGRWADNPQ